MPLSRRALLRGTIVSAACLAWPAVSRSGDATWASPLLEDESQSAEWSLAGPSVWATGEANGLIRLPEGGLTLAGGSSGTYRSVAHQFPFRADGAGLLWALEGPADALTIRLRAGDDGRTWSDWQTARPLTHGPRDVTGASELVGLSGRFWQIDIELRPMAEGRPVLRRVAVRAVGSRGPDIGQAAAAAATPIGALAGGGLGPPAPRIISRRDWGCPQPISSPAWPPEYRDAVKIFVHHTVTTNNDLNPPATVRAIWQYHAITLDWGDIGYNYLIDRYGNVYEGRYGGDNVVAGHALCYNRGSVGIALLGDFTSTAPTGAAIDALIALTAWLTYRRRIHPLKSAYFVNRVLANICSHRDGNDACGFHTECPGDRLQARLVDVRNEVWARFPEYALEWGVIATPGRLTAGEAVTVRAAVANLGRRFWNNTDPFPFHLGYRWYRPDGSQAVQPTEEDRRTKLPQGLDFGARAQVDGWLQAPREAGRYTLRWDMVHEGHTWFADRGNPTVDATVEVSSPRPTYQVNWGSHSTPIRLAPGETTRVRLDLQNTGTATWHATAPNSFRVGYHWYRPDGSQVVQPPGDDRRTHFPREVTTDQWVTVEALLTAPGAPGSYNLTWDVVHEGITWFADQGSPTVNVHVEVSGELRRVFLPAIQRASGPP